MPKFQRVYKGVDDKLSDDWADYWEREAGFMADLADEKRMLLARTFQANRVHDLVVNNCKFSVHKPKMIRDQAVNKWQTLFDTIAPTKLKITPAVAEKQELVIDYKQIERDLGLDCPRTPITYRGNNPNAN